MLVRIITRPHIFLWQQQRLYWVNKPFDLVHWSCGWWADIGQCPLISTFCNANKQKYAPQVLPQEKGMHKWLIITKGHKSFYPMTWLFAFVLHKVCSDVSLSLHAVLWNHNVPYLTACPGVLYKYLKVISAFAFFRRSVPPADERIWLFMMRVNLNSLGI